MLMVINNQDSYNSFKFQGQDGKNHFVFVTNLSPCSGVRLHLWREKETSASEVSMNKRVVEVTAKMVHVPSGPAPRQVLCVFVIARAFCDELIFIY